MRRKEKVEKVSQVTEIFGQEGKIIIYYFWRRSGLWYRRKYTEYGWYRKR